MTQKPDIHCMRADYSTDRMHYKADPTQKAYQGHLTFEQLTNQWVAWATHGPADRPSRQRALIGQDADIYKAAQALDDRLDAKARKGYALTEGGYAQADYTQIQAMKLKTQSLDRQSA